MGGDTSALPSDVEHVCTHRVSPLEILIASSDPGAPTTGSPTVGIWCLGCGKQVARIYGDPADNPWGRAVVRLS